MKVLYVLVAAMGLAICTGHTHAAAVTEQTVEIPMRDGVVLAADLVKPDSPGAYPAILVRTPYGRGQHRAEARFWAAGGYAVVIQDARGKFDSGGDYLPFVHEHDDGMDTLDWIAGREWCNGRIGMWGSSYLAFCQLVLASTGHPALVSILPISGWIDDDGQIEHGGAHHIMLSLPWILHEESQTSRSLADYDINELFEYLPLIDALKSVGLDSRIWNEEFDFSSLDDYHAANIDIPAFHITGWNDFVHDAALSIYRQTLESPARTRQKLMVGPWFHDQWWTTYTEVGDEDFGPGSAMGRERLMRLSLEWFDATVKGDGTTLDQWPGVRLFVMGANRWNEYETFPPADARELQLYLGSTRGANSRDGDGFLSNTPPASPGHDTYRFDPYNPVPTWGGANMHFMMHLVGVKDQREIEERDDVLVYTGEPLADDMDIVGPVSARLYVSTEGRDTDFTAKLVEVRPDGYARIIEEGIIRASFRSGTGRRELLTPGEVYRVSIDLGSTAIRIPAGNRLRVEVSSSNFPKYDRNPNTGEDALQASVLETVTQSVYFGAEYPSHIVLTVAGNGRHE